MNKKIDIQKYEGHTEGKWEYDSATIHATAKGGNEIIAEYPCWNYNKDQLITKEEEANLRLMADAPLILDAYNKKCNEAKWLREALQIITKDLDSAIAQGHIPIRATDEIDVTKIRNFAHDASI